VRKADVEPLAEDRKDCKSLLGLISSIPQVMAFCSFSVFSFNKTDSFIASLIVPNVSEEIKKVYDD
jgi:hypothetical protein